MAMAALLTLGRLDRRATALMQTAQLPWPLEYLLAPFAFSFGWLGTFAGIVPALVLFGLFVDGGQLFICFSSAANMASVAIRGIKLVVARDRPNFDSCPPRSITPKKPSTGSPDWWSFPSGDVAVAAVFSSSLLASGHVADSGLVPVLVLTVVLTAVGRMYWWYHWLADTVFGALLGVTCTAAVCTFQGTYGELQFKWWVCNLMAFVVGIQLTKPRPKAT